MITVTVSMEAIGKAIDTLEFAIQVSSAHTANKLREVCDALHAMNNDTDALVTCRKLADMLRPLDAPTPQDNVE